MANFHFSDLNTEDHTHNWKQMFKLKFKMLQSLLFHFVVTIFAQQMSSEVNADYLHFLHNTYCICDINIRISPNILHKIPLLHLSPLCLQSPSLSQMVGLNP